MRPPVGPGDFLRVLALAPSESARDSLAGLLGLRGVPTATATAALVPAEPRPPDVPRATATAALVPAELRPPDEPRSPQDQHPVKLDRVLEPAVVEPTERGDDTAALVPAEPEWWGTTEPIASEPDAAHGRTAPLIPLFHPDRQRDILRRLLEVARLDRRLDVAELTRRVSRHLPVVRIPRLKVRRLAASVAMIVDPTPTMLAYQDDVLAVAAELRNLVGRSSLWLVHTREPSLRSLQGVVVLIVSDLRGPWASAVGSDGSTWIDVIRTVTAGGAEVKLLMPAAVTSGMPSIPARIVEWSRRTHAGDLRRHRPHLAEPGKSLPLMRMAMALAPAVRIEPALIRRIRIELMPDDGPEIEGSLRASELVDVANAGGITLRRDARERLMGGLARRPQRLDAAMSVIEAIHAGGPPLITLEESVTRLALEERPGWEALAAAQVRRVTRTMSDSRRGLARWLEQAATRLPAAIVGSQSFAEAVIRAEHVLQRPVAVSAALIGISGEVARFLREAPCEPMTLPGCGRSRYDWIPKVEP